MIPQQYVSFYNHQHFQLHVFVQKVQQQQVLMEPAYVQMERLTLQTVVQTIIQQHVLHYNHLQTQCLVHVQKVQQQQVLMEPVSVQMDKLMQ